MIRRRGKDICWKKQQIIIVISHKKKMRPWRHDRIFCLSVWRSLAFLILPHQWWGRALLKTESGQILRLVSKNSDHRRSCGWSPHLTSHLWYILQTISQRLGISRPILHFDAGFSLLSFPYRGMLQYAYAISLIFFSFLIIFVGLI